ncbi:hypothetical protein JTB14_019638 [Gonioctena quinquepunctata]|nr:hypothetical protein JTB14_019638 [Gonioctena quinquepunctata]
MKFAIMLFALASTALAEKDALQEFIEGNLQFTSALYKELITSEKGNFIMSPFSAETILALTREGARGESATEMATGLHLPSTIENTKEAFKAFLTEITSSRKYLRMLSANRIYVGNNVKLENEFQQVAEEIYKSGIENVNFTDNEAAAENINGWVEHHTQNRIKNLIDPSTINDETIMILVNALFFKGVWENRFSVDDTAPKKFHKSKEDTVDVDMMVQTETFGYYECPKVNAKFLEMGYRGGNVSMVIVLPNELEGLAALEQNMEEILKPQPLVATRVAVQIPKFEIHTKIEMIPILEKLGIRKVFDPQEADLSGLSSTNKHLFISKVVQKAFISVNEAGTEAAAATSVAVNRRLSTEPEPKTFEAHHPFTYFIKYNGVILFAGRYTM